MKKNILLILFAWGTCMSCNDFLEVTPQSRVVPADFLDSELEVEQGVVAIYRQFRNLYINEQWKWTDLISDNTTNDTLSTDGFPEEIDEFLIQSGFGLIRTYWSSSYQGVYRCNIVIDALENPDPGLRFEEASTRNRAEGEARFFRAFFYFNLVRLYGDVPLITMIFDGVDDRSTFANTPREPINNIYQQLIIPDLLAAVDLLPNEYDALDLGRATSGAALTLLGEVYLTRGDFPNAIETFERVSSLGYTLNTNYQDNFAPETKNGPESIFELQFSLQVPQPANFYRNWVPANSGSSVIPSIDAQDAAGKNLPTQDLVAAFETGDRRSDISVAFFERTAQAQSGEDSTVFVPFINKYNYEFINERGLEGQDINFPVYRYADVLLMLAEAYNENTPGTISESALLLINRVRVRAGLEPILRGVDVADQQDLRLVILRERRVELAFENKRWFDLLRMENYAPGFTLNLMEAHSQQEIAEKGGSLDPLAYQNIRLDLGIPREEVLLYGYEQNQGWE